jgi:integrase
VKSTSEWALSRSEERWSAAWIVLVQTPKEIPTIKEFANVWLEAERDRDLGPRTIEDRAWRIGHLLSWFVHEAGDPRLDHITAQTVDEYRSAKKRQGKLAAESINRTIDTLAAVLDLAIDYGHVERNVARGRRRKLATRKKRPVYLDGADQIVAILDAARELDGAKTSRTSDRYPLVATLLFAGPRAEEAGELLVRDLDLDRGYLEVGRSKTDAGLRKIDLLPVLQDVLATYKAGHRGGVDDLLFTTRAGTARNRHNIARRVLTPVVARADELLEQRRQHPMPRGVTAHKMRHTFASILFAIGRDAPYVMGQLGHNDPAFTLRVYGHVMRFSSQDRARLKALVDGVADR